LQVFFLQNYEPIQKCLTVCIQEISGIVCKITAQDNRKTERPEVYEDLVRCWFPSRHPSCPVAKRKRGAKARFIPIYREDLEARKIQSEANDE